MEPFKPEAKIIDVPEAPGVEGLRVIVEQIRNSEYGVPIHFRGTPVALRLMHLVRFDKLGVLVPIT
jgi:hypothetical protein